MRTGVVAAHRTLGRHLPEQMRRPRPPRRTTWRTAVRRPTRCEAAQAVAW